MLAVTEVETDIEEILVTTEAISQKVQDLGKQITNDYQGKNLVLLGVLKGSFLFMADIARAIHLPLQIEFIQASSYGSNVFSSGEVKVFLNPDFNIKGKDILIIEDIIDAGLTLKALKEEMVRHNAASVKTCAFLEKQTSRRTIDISAEYVGFTIPDKFVVGYGLDYDQKYRNLSYVGVLKPSIYTKE